MGERIYSYNEMFAAMCIMEEIRTTSLPDASQPWEAFWDAQGINHLRHVVIERLALECDQAWHRANDLHEAAWAQWDSERVVQQQLELPGAPHDRRWLVHNPPPEYPGAFDYDFVPTWLRLRVDWSDPVGGPRVRGVTTMSKDAA